MLSPMARLIAVHPRLAAEHAQAYAGLLAVDMRRSAISWARRALLYVAAVCAASVAAVLGGTAWMLWAAGLRGSGPETAAIPAAFFIAPGVALAVALACAWRAQWSDDAGPLTRVRGELANDLAALRAAKTAASPARPPEGAGTAVSSTGPTR